VRDVFVGVGKRGEGLAEMPGDIGREHAQENVGTDAFGEVVEDGAQVEVVGFNDTEVPFDVREVFVGGDDPGSVQGLCAQAGTYDIDPIERGFGVDLFLIAMVSEGVLRDGEGKVFRHLVLVDDLTDGHADIIGSAQFPVPYACGDLGEFAVGGGEQLLACACSLLGQH